MLLNKMHKRISRFSRKSEVNNYRVSNMPSLMSEGIKEMGSTLDANKRSNSYFVQTLWANQKPPHKTASGEEPLEAGYNNATVCNSLNKTGFGNSFTGNPLGDIEPMSNKLSLPEVVEQLMKLDIPRSGMPCTEDDKLNYTQCLPVLPSKNFEKRRINVCAGGNKGAMERIASYAKHKPKPLHISVNSVKNNRTYPVISGNNNDRRNIDATGPEGNTRPVGGPGSNVIPTVGPGNNTRSTVPGVKTGVGSKLKLNRNPVGNRSRKLSHKYSGMGTIWKAPAISSRTNHTELQGMRETNVKIVTHHGGEGHKYGVSNDKRNSARLVGAPGVWK